MIGFRDCLARLGLVHTLLTVGHSPSLLKLPDRLHVAFFVLATVGYFGAAVSAQVYTGDANWAIQTSKAMISLKSNSEGLGPRPKTFSRNNRLNHGNVDTKTTRTTRRTKTRKEEEDEEEADDNDDNKYCYCCYCYCC